MIHPTLHKTARHDSPGKRVRKLMREMGIAETELQSVGRYEGAVNGEPLSRQSREALAIGHIRDSTK